MTPSDLKDGLRMLILQEGKFWPARLNSTKLPDVYGVVMDRQRGNRPIILPRDDILKEAVSSMENLYKHRHPTNVNDVKDIQIIIFYINPTKKEDQEEEIYQPLFLF